MGAGPENESGYSGRPLPGFVWPGAGLSMALRTYHAPCFTRRMRPVSIPPCSRPWTRSLPGFTTSVTALWIRDGRLRWVHVYGRSYIAETGDVVRLAGVVQDITQQIASEESQRQVLDLFEQSPVGIAIISPDNLTIRMANPFYSYLVGRAPEQIVGKPLLEALPELDGQGFDPAPGGAGHGCSVRSQ